MEIVREIQPQLARVTGVRAFANNPGSFGQSPRSKPVEFVIQTAEGYDKLNEYVERFLAEAEKNPGRSEEHTSELQSLMRSSYAVFCLKKKKTSKRTCNPESH